jgi:deazaflavin-dependent oxidoreductase (nitroreductase family)
MENNNQYLYLTTIGRKSGQPREIEIWFTKLNGLYYLIAEKGEQANWVRNILHNDAVSFRVESQFFKGTGRVIYPGDEFELWQNVRALSDRKYGWSEGLVVELAPHA